jgi:hypothetical protein
LGAVAKKRLTDKVSVLVAHDDDRATRGFLSFNDVTAIDPEMSAANAISAALCNCDRVHLLLPRSKESNT